MVNNNIFLGSGASLTFCPELDLKIEIDETSGSLAQVTMSTSFTDDFGLVNDLYVGCILEVWNASTRSTTHRITANTDTTINVVPNLTVTDSNTYIVIKSYGAPSPAKKVSSGTAHTAAITTITFNSDTVTDYNDDTIIFSALDANGGSAILRGVSFDTTGSQAYTGALSGAGNIQEADISGQNTREEYAAILAAEIGALTNLTATRSGATVTVTTAFNGSNAVATTLLELDGTTARTNTNLTITTTVGTTTTTSVGKRLLSDEWLGLLETGTFPTTEVEPKAMNLSLGGDRNKTYQYKGIETSQGGNLALVANHASWLYYFLGRCTAVAATTTATAPTDAQHPAAGQNNAVFIDKLEGGGGIGFTDTGPIFNRSKEGVMSPHINTPLETVADLQLLTTPAGTTTISDSINYTFAESNSDELPSFAIEQVISKLDSSNTGSIYRTDSTASTNESQNFVKIARGNRVNTLTLTANENEELKMTLDLNTRAVHTPALGESYEARAGVTSNTSLFNYPTQDELREPFFFSDGALNIFGQNFLRVTAFTLTMNNNLQDKRFLGAGSISVKEGIPAERTYEITLSGMVTDDTLYRELVSRTETDDGSNNITLNFSKSNGENIVLEFTNYMLTANNFPLNEDKSAIIVEATIVPRVLKTCTVNTHWILQG